VLELEWILGRRPKWSVGSRSQWSSELDEGQQWRRGGARYSRVRPRGRPFIGGEQRVGARTLSLEAREGTQGGPGHSGARTACHRRTAQAGPTQARGRSDTRWCELRRAWVACGFGLCNLRRREPAGDPDVEAGRGATRCAGSTRSGTGARRRDVTSPKLVSFSRLRPTITRDFATEVLQGVNSKVVEQ
jgi:hypothetical protein